MKKGFYLITIIILILFIFTSPAAAKSAANPATNDGLLITVSAMAAGATAFILIKKSTSRTK